MNLKPMILLLFVIHLIKSILLFMYNKKTNSTITVSDFIAYIMSGYFSLYIEKEPKNRMRNFILFIHYSILALALLLIIYAFYLIL